VETSRPTKEGTFFPTPSASLIPSYTAEVPSWGLDRINQCERPLDDVVTKQNAAGVMVFVFDTGVYGEHDEFKDIIGPDDCHLSIVEGKNPLEDEDGHG